MYQSFDDIIKAACGRRPRRTIAIAQAADEKMIHVAREVTAIGLCDVILVGDAGKIRALMAADGLPVDYEDMKKRFGPVIGRPHFADLLVELGLAENVRDAFDRYVEKGQRYYVGRTILPIERAIEIIRLSGGVPVLAHPFQYKLDDAGLRELIEHCMAQGLRGMECRYSGYGPEQSAYLEKLAEEYGLVKTGGSDFHGSNKPQISLGSGIEGKLHVPWEWLERLKEEAGI